MVPSIQLLVYHKMFGKNNTVLAHKSVTEKALDDSSEKIKILYGKSLESEVYLSMVPSIQVLGQEDNLIIAPCIVSQLLL